jgi:HlyD family secretion protein
VALANYDPTLERGAGSSRSGSSDIGKSFKVEILIDTKGLRFFSGLSADADIETKRHEKVLKVPSQCVLGRSPDSLPAEIRSKGEVDTTKATIPVVYRLIDGQAVATPVKIGSSDLTHTVIESGLSAGDEVITGPYKVLESLQHGQKLKKEIDSTTKPATLPTTTATTSRSF